ncbi:MAG: response regulator [Ktedonobacterales bacterium]
MVDPVVEPAVDAPSATILVIEDDTLIARMLAETLKMEGYATVVAHTGETGIDAAIREMPQLVLLDLLLPGIDGFGVVAQLRANIKTSHIPVVIISAVDDTADKLRAFDAQVDDYLTKPFDGGELMARIRTQLRHVQENLLSPLTRLPGGQLVERAIEQQLHSHRPWSILYLDLDHFKAYNDVYGFLSGNDLIRLLARIAAETVRDLGGATDFVGHIGGDDFIIISTPERVAPICEHIFNCWRAESPAFYSAADVARGAISVRDRQGALHEFPLVSISVGVVTNERRLITTMEEVSRIAAEVKYQAKTLPGDSCFVDQRA